MTYNRSDIMKSAWIIVRRLQGNGETLAALLSRALKSAWATAKMNAAAAHASKQSAKAKDAIEARSIDSLQSEATTLENQTRLGFAGRERLSQFRAAIRAAHVADVAGGHGRLAVLAVLAGPNPENAKNTSGLAA
ncbi:hypothetical protein ROA7450_03361 [Roseovarius albus]|uniref:Uncharacterized protein n=1 Tax=Roseovarius albus TaxID=1247867 RepID=A0A1X6ZWM6_9RHOB|nr:hypothetical protein [Roseovarius albus]SLN63932.1 hypothetical protein ROA7450_03361 [Roseovarius albus]